jgi:predicted kinase
LQGRNGSRGSDSCAVGHTVIADSVNPPDVTREAWRNVAARAGVDAVEIELICPDRAEHRRRVEARAALVPVTWQQVEARNYERWTVDHICIDTAGRDIEQSLAVLWQALPPALRSQRFR